MAKRKLGQEQQPHLPPPLSDDIIAYKLWNSARQRAQAKGKTFTITVEDVIAGVKAGKCPQTGMPFIDEIDSPWRASLDRIDNERGYEPDNIQVVAKIYNVGKWTFTDKDMDDLGQAITAKKQDNDFESMSIWGGNI